MMTRQRERLIGFARDEDGGMIVFTLMFFVMMLILGGIAVDMVRFETTRSRLQGVSDRAILAAADLDQVYTAF